MAKKASSDTDLIFQFYLPNTAFTIFSHEEFETMLPPTLAYINALLSTAVQSVNFTYRLPNFFLRFEAEQLTTGVTFVT